MNRYRNLIVNIGLFALNSVATKLISFFLVPLYTSYMSAGEYGLTDMATTVISLIHPLITLDIADAAVRYITDDKDNEDKYAAISFMLTMISIIVVALLSPFLDLGAFGGLGEFKAWFIADYAATALMNLCGEIARGSGKIKLIPICAAVSSTVTLVCAVVFIASLNMGIVGYFSSVCIGPSCAILIYIVFGRFGSTVAKGVRNLVQNGRSSVKKTITSMLRYSLPLVPNSLFWWAGNSVSRLFITGMIGISASGMFAAAGKIPSLINIAYNIFQQAWQLSAFQEVKKKNISSFYTTVFCVISVGLTILCSILSLFAPSLASILLKGESYDAWPMISLLLFANLMNNFNVFYGTVYTSTMHTGYIMRTAIFGELICVIFTPLLIPYMGTYGACVASIIGQGLVFILRAHDSRKYIYFDVSWKTLVPTLFLLFFQSVVTALQLPVWRMLSLVCTLLVVFIQSKRLISFLLDIKKRKGGNAL